MAPTKEEPEGALSEIESIFANRKAKIAEAYANHPDPDAWTLHYVKSLSMILQGPLSKVEEKVGSVAPARGVKRCRVQDDEEEEMSQGISDGGRVLETEGNATYTFTGPAKFRVETDCGKFQRTLMLVDGHTKVFVEDATKVKVEKEPV